MASERQTKARRYRAFITYSHRDKHWARWLHRRLELYRVPRHLVGRRTAAGKVPPRLTPVFRDREELGTADDLGERITDALARSGALVVVCSPAATGSRWVNEEIRRFQATGRGHRIFCLMVDGDAAAGDQATATCLPSALREVGSTESHPEPLAADLRPGGDGRTLAFLKIVSGLLDVDLDELRRREHQRRNRRLLAVTAASLVIAGATSVLAFEAFVSRQSAVAARDTAQQQRAQAEGLIAFMLGKLRGELEPLGKLSLLDMLAKRALAYYQSQNPRALDADSLAERAKALRLIGQVYLKRGATSEALLAFRQSAASTSQLLSHAPGSQRRIYDHALSVYYVASVYVDRGQYAKAMDEFRLYRALASRLVAVAPENPKWQTELQDAYVDLGAVLQKQGDLEQARVMLRKALVVAQKMAARTPGDNDARFDLAQTRAWLSDVELRMGDLKAARRERIEELAIYRGLLARDPKNSRAQQSLITTQRRLARIAVARGELAAASELLDEAQKTAYALMARDPTNKLWQELDGDVCVERGEVLYYRQEQGAARAAAEAEGLALSLVARDSTVRNWQLLRARAWALQARLRSRRGDHRAAARLLRKAAEQLIDLHVAHDRDDDTADLLARVELRLGDELNELGDRSGAREAWTASLRTATSLGSVRNLTTRAVSGLAAERLGQYPQARRIAARLEAVHYRAPVFLELQKELAALRTPVRNPPGLG